MTDSNNKNDGSIEDLEKKVEQLKNKYIELDKKYIGYLEADLNRQAGSVNKKKNEVEKEIYILIDRIKSKKEFKRIKEEEMYRISQKMKSDLKLYEMFLINKGLLNEFETFKDEQEEEEQIL